MDANRVRAAQNTAVVDEHVRGGRVELGLGENAIRAARHVQQIRRPELGDGSQGERPRQVSSAEDHGRSDFHQQAFRGQGGPAVRQRVPRRPAHPAEALRRPPEARGNRSARRAGGQHSRTALAAVVLAVAAVHGGRRALHAVRVELGREENASRPARHVQQVRRPERGDGPQGIRRRRRG